MIVTTGGIAAPVGGRIHIVSVPVDESRDWDAVRAAGPDTPVDYAVWEVGDQYPPVVGATQELQEVIVNFGKNIQSKDILAWGKEQRLRPVTPRACLAIGEHQPNLHRDLGLDFMAIVALTPCSFEGRSNVVVVWFERSRRRVVLRWFSSVWDVSFWFAFARE